MVEVQEGKFYRDGRGLLIGPMTRIDGENGGQPAFSAGPPGSITYRIDGASFPYNYPLSLVQEVSGEELYDEVLTTFGPLHKHGSIPPTEAAKVTTKADILQEAIGTVAQRGEAYDGVEDNFVRIERYWNAHLVNRFGAEAAEKCELNAIDVAQMMILMKQARIDFKQDHHDSWVDTCGYGGCGGELAAKEVAE